MSSCETGKPTIANVLKCLPLKNKREGRVFEGTRKGETKDEIWGEERGSQRVEYCSGPER